MNYRYVCTCGEERVENVPDDCPVNQEISCGGCGQYMGMRAMEHFPDGCVLVIEELEVHDGDGCPTCAHREHCRNYCRTFAKGLPQDCRIFLPEGAVEVFDEEIVAC